ncbi:hypothetical protein ACFL60_09915 [Candidatus Omnitrophota bacterium]
MMTARTEIRLSGLALILAAVLWIISEIIEMIQGGYSPLQLTLTATAFALLPYGFLGIHRAQAEKGGILSFFGAMCSGISFIICSGAAMIEIVLEAREILYRFTLVAGGCDCVRYCNRSCESFSQMDRYCFCCRESARPSHVCAATHCIRFVEYCFLFSVMCTRMVSLD